MDKGQALSYRKPKNPNNCFAINNRTISQGDSYYTSTCNCNISRTNITNIIPNDLNKSNFSSFTSNVYTKKKAKARYNSCMRTRSFNNDPSTLPLNQTIQRIKVKIEKGMDNPAQSANLSTFKSSKSVSPIPLPKINPKVAQLTQIAFCYFRLSSKKEQKLNPFTFTSDMSLVSSPFNFTKGTISLNKNITEIVISSSLSLKSPIKIPLTNVEGTLIHSSIKKISEITRQIKKQKLKTKLELDRFSNSAYCKSLGATNSEVYKASENTVYNFTVIYDSGKRIEIVLDNFDDFKVWINGIAYIAKNKGQINLFILLHI